MKGDNQNIKWVTDANMMDIKSIGDLIFKNGIINSYLNRPESYFISANKGMGKTMLLSHKRYTINQAYEYRKRKGEIANSIIMVPNDSPYLDTMDEINQISEDKITFLSNINNSKKLWIFCLKLSSILNFFGEQGLSREIFKKLSADIRDIIKNGAHNKKGKYLPTYFFSQTLHSISFSELKRLFIDTDTLINAQFQTINSAIFFFIDKIDQSISDLSKDAWINIQAGLIEGAWNTMEQNHHVKVYTSIRQEAFSNYSSSQKENLENFVKTIRYNFSDVIHIIDKLTSKYEGKETFKEYLGMDTILNGGGNVKEDTFKYIFRHTTGRPRELVSIISAISDERNDLTTSRFKEIVNDKSSTLIPERFSETKTFLNCLNDSNNRQRFYSLLKHNIISRQETEEICLAFNNITEEYYQQLEYPKGDILHPFCDLYSCGLLGVVGKDVENNQTIQFKQPKDIISFFPTLMPHADLYFIHPSLERAIRISSQDSYNTFDYIVVGHNYPWSSLYKMAYMVQKEFYAIEKQRFKDTAKLLLKALIIENNPNVDHLFKQLVEMEEQQNSDSKKKVIFYIEEYLYG